MDAANSAASNEGETPWKIKKPIKCPIVSICGERKIIFFNSVGSNTSLEKNSKMAALIISMKKVKWCRIFTSKKR